MFIIKYKKIFVGISGLLVVLSIVAISFLGINIGIDFKGGALTEVAYTTERPAQDLIESRIAPLELGSVLVQPAGELGYLVKTREITEDEHSSLLQALSVGEDTLEEKSFNSIGPSVGQELTRKAIIALVLVSLGIILFIAFAFRRVSKPVSSWKYGLIAVTALLHDAIIPVGLFSFLSHFYGAEVDTLFVVALLTILGLSVSDTIVIFDRIRENLREKTKDTFAETVGKSLKQSYLRSIFTSLTLMFVLVALVIWGPTSTRFFALMLTAGMFFGTYSSIFLASPLLAWVEELQKKD